MKTEERIREELQKLKSEQNPNNANKIDALELVLNDYEPLDGFYVISGYDHVNEVDIDVVVKGIDNAKKLFNQYSSYKNIDVSLHNACINRYGEVIGESVIGW